MKISPIFQDTECCICLDDIYCDPNTKCSNLLFTTPCGHKFHTHCLREWCINDNSCPTCRRIDVMNKDVKVYKSIATYISEYTELMNLFTERIYQISRCKTPRRDSQDGQRIRHNNIEQVSYSPPPVHIPERRNMLL